MKENLYQTERNKGIALLFLLLGVVVLMLGYFLVLNPRPSSDSLKLHRQEPEKYPWVEENRIKKDPAEIRKPEPEQPQLNEVVIYKGDVRKDAERRGSVLIKTEPDGIVEALWMGDYMTDAPRMEFDVIAASAKGNIDPSKIYEDGVVIDYEKLYIITKGTFSMLETNYDNGKVRTVRGFLYMTGWLDKNDKIKGYLTITSDKENVQVFEYIAEKTDLESFPAEGSIKDLIKKGLQR